MKYVLLIGCVFLPLALFADQDSALKRKIISDCAEAQTDFRAISEEQKQKNEEVDKAYKSATEQLPSRKTNADPWQNVRGADQKQTKTVSPRN